MKFDGYRSQYGGVRILTRRGLDWTSKYRDLASAAVSLNVESAIIDGEIIVTNEATVRLRRAPEGHCAPPRTRMHRLGAATSWYTSKHRPEAKKRKCMCRRHAFMLEGFHNRICTSCKESQLW